MPLIYLVAGEHSGDILGSRLMAALRQADPATTFAGVAGPRMQAEGMDSLFPMSDLNVMGLLEILPRFHILRRRMLSVVADIAARRPAVVVTVDSPGFGLHVLRRIGTLGIPRVQYVAPQVWAWREHRVKTFPGLWEELLCLLPFEEAYFARHGLRARFVGHPVLQSGADEGDGARFRSRHAVPDGAPVLILMPGSRRSEVPRLLPVFGRTLALLKAEQPDLVPVVPVAHAVAELVQAATATWPIRPVIVTETEDKHDAYAAAAAALTKSGTSTLELALAGVPMAVTYRVNPVSAAMARRMIRVPHVAMVNLLAGRLVVPELLQEDCNPATLCATVLTLIRDQPAAQAQRAASRAAVLTLAPATGTPAEAAAQAVRALLPTGDSKGVASEPRAADNAATQAGERPMPSTITLYGFNGSTYVRTVKMLLAEKGVGDIEQIPLNVLTGEPKSPEHLERHPFGKVPVLEHDGLRILETSAIARYLNDVLPGPSLVPATPKDRARMNMIIGLIDSYGYGALIGGVAAYHLFPDFVGGKNDTARENGLESGRKVIEFAMQTRAGSPFIAGELSLADLYLAPIAAYLSMTPDKDALFSVPGFEDWWTKIQALPSFQSTPPQ